MQYYVEDSILSVGWSCLLFLKLMQIQYIKVFKGHNFQTDKNNALLLYTVWRNIVLELVPSCLYRHLSSVSILVLAEDLVSFSEGWGIGKKFLLLF